MREIQIEKVSVDQIEACKGFIVSGQVTSNEDGPVRLKFIRAEKFKVEDSGKCLDQAASEHVVFEETFWPGGKSKGGVSPFSFPVKYRPTLSFTEQDASTGNLYKVELSYFIVAIDASLDEEVAKLSVNLDNTTNSGQRPKISFAEKLYLSSGFCCCFNQQTEYVEILLSCETDTVEQGMTLALFVEVYNYASLNVKTMHVQLSREILAGSSQINKTFSKMDFNGVDAGKYSPCFPVNIEIPPRAVPTVDFSGFKCLYFVDVSAVLEDSTKRHLRVPISVVPCTPTLSPRESRKNTG